VQAQPKIASKVLKLYRVWFGREDCEGGWGQAGLGFLKFFLESQHKNILKFQYIMENYDLNTLMNKRIILEIHQPT